MADTPDRSMRALTIGPDTPAVFRLGVVVIILGAAFGAGVWATTMANGLEALTKHADQTDAKLEKLESLLHDLVRAIPPAHRQPAGP